MKCATADPYTAEICIACPDVGVASRVCRDYCDEVGLCVTVVEADYIYTGGSEAGIIVRLINYPRFPAAKETIYAKAYGLAKRLKYELYQQSFSLLTPDSHYWESDDAPQ